MFLKRVPYNDQFCKNRSLKFDKTFRTREEQDIADIF